MLTSSRFLDDLLSTWQQGHQSQDIIGAGRGGRGGRGGELRTGRAVFLLVQEREAGQDKGGRISSLISPASFGWVAAAVPGFDL